MLMMEQPVFKIKGFSDEQIQILGQLSCVLINSFFYFSQGEYISSAKGSQLQVYFFKKQKAYR